MANWIYNLLSGNTVTEELKDDLVFVDETIHMNIETDTEVNLLIGDKVLLKNNFDMNTKTKRAPFDYFYDDSVFTVTNGFSSNMIELENKIKVTYNYFDEENEKSFITNSDLCATVVVKNYIFVSDFDEKILKLIHLENSVSSQNGKRFIVETNTISEEIEEFYFLKKI
ncbi:hypothetical protein CWI37_1583p0010 [Hamiltosporidium tvaerminnensis]|uniref:Uncharacterized protein n=1 Tax=Hamiltosporidium tvaerminnensis TaxID=1176355 RepID=A0A4Q9KW39_9MICR|nr:hypothetical protein CWI37_1583p0010 [Hamiltosporidium tvaerminnensis]